MRNENASARRRATRDLGVDGADGERGVQETFGMSSRGTKYWNIGSIPLIAPDVLGGIISDISDIAIVVGEDGMILSVLVDNIGRSLGAGKNWEGHDIREYLTSESIAKFDTQLDAFVTGGTTSGPMELNHISLSAWDAPVRYSLHAIGPEGAILMLGRDQSPVAEMQQQLVKAQMALEHDYEDQRRTETRFRVLMEQGRDAVLFVNVTSGRVTDANSSAAALIGVPVEDLVGSAIAQEFDSQRRGEFLAELTAAAADDQVVPIEISARRSKRKLVVSSRLFRAAGERMLMCRLEDADVFEQSSDELTENLSGLYQDGVDAIVFTDRDGVVRAANEAFLSLADVAHLSAIKGRALADYLVRGAVDMKVLIENAARTGRMRMFSTKLLSEYGNQTSVEVSATYLNDRTHPALVFVIRDTSRTEALHRPGVAVSDDGVRNVMELVGSTTLKDIVSETTEVVEKMCIETAVELTHNNRVAAAEMLGLSRQSLYVKLRKYGLLNRGG